MKIHTGDTVVVIGGRDKGKVGRILRVLTEKRRVVVAGANLRTRHLRKTPQSPGRIVRYEASLHASNVMLIDPKTKKRTRVGCRSDDRGGKERFAKVSGEAILSGRKLKRLVEEEEEEMGKREGKKQRDVSSGLPARTTVRSDGQPADPAAGRDTQEQP